jgi:Lon protease-like protein
MFEIPLFPLNTVLFPGMPLPLRIFEDRYKRMIRLCLEKSQSFGVVLIRQGSEALGPLAEPYEIGCTARIIEVQPLAEGQMNIITLGENRFRIVSTYSRDGYLVGKVELFPLEEASSNEMTSHAQRLLPWVKQYMQILSEASKTDLEPEKLPADPVVLAYLAAVLVQIPPEQKQALLAEQRAIDLLGNMERIYRREVAMLQAIMDHGPRQDPGPFSTN